MDCTDTYLAVDTLELAEDYVHAWAKRGIKAKVATSMTEAIELLMKNDYLFVGINSDVINFWSLLLTMRSVTNTPLFVATANWTLKKELAALRMGADMYGQWQGSIDENIDRVLAHVERVNAWNSENPRILSKVLINYKLIIGPHGVFLNNKKIKFTPQEKRILLYLCINKGIELTHDQIIEDVWDIASDSGTYENLHKRINKIRKKLPKEYIETVHGIGYTMPILD